MLTKKHLVKIEDPHTESFLFDWQATRPTPVDEAKSAGEGVVNLDSLMGQVGAKLDEFEEDDKKAQDKADEKTKAKLSAKAVKNVDATGEVSIRFSSLPAAIAFLFLRDEIIGAGGPIHKHQIFKFTRGPRVLPLPV